MTKKRSKTDMIFDPRVTVIDHDPYQWANIFEFLKPTDLQYEIIYILHENGKVLKKWPGYRTLEIGNIIEKPRKFSNNLAKKENSIVCLIDLNSWNSWLDKFQII